MLRTCTSCGKVNRIPARHLADTGKCGECKASLPPVDRPIDVSAAEFDEIVRDARVPVLVDFWAAWCGPCKMAAPNVARVAADMRGRAVVLKVDTERNRELAARFQIQGIPHFMVFRAGQPVMAQSGLVDAGTMTGWLRQAAP